MNFNQACEDAEADNIRVKSVRVSDDIASAPKGKRQEDAELRDYFFAYKMACAAANRMMPLGRGSPVAKARLWKIHVRWESRFSCVIPEVGKPHIFYC